MSEGLQMVPKQNSNKDRTRVFVEYEPGLTSQTHGFLNWVHGKYVENKKVMLSKCELCALGCVSTLICDFDENSVSTCSLNLEIFAILRNNKRTCLGASKLAEATAKAQGLFSENIGDVNISRQT